MAGSEDDKQQSAMAPFAPFAIPQPARLGEEATTVPGEHNGLDLKQEFFRFLDSCVAYRDTETKQQYAKDLAEALAARDTAKEHAQELQHVINANEQIIAELRRDMENLQEDLERYRTAMKKNDRSSARVQARHKQMLMGLAPGYCAMAREIITLSPSWFSEEMDSFARTIERELDTNLSLKRRACSNRLDYAQANGVRRKA